MTSQPLQAHLARIRHYRPPVPAEAGSGPHRPGKQHPTAEATNRVSAQKTLHQTRNIIDQLAPILERARYNLRIWSERGYPTSSRHPQDERHEVLDADQAGRPNPDADLRYPSPTERAAVAGGPDLALAARSARWLAEIEYSIRLAERNLEQALRRAKAATVTSTNPGAEGCKSCARMSDHEGQWQPIKAKGMCSFCLEFDGRYGEPPAKPVLAWHLSHLGANVPRNLVREHHPDAWARHHTRRNKTRS